jgi:hypothetical protein
MNFGTITPTPSFTPYAPNIPPTIPIGFKFPNFDFDFRNTARGYKGKQRTKYTPSFENIIGLSKGKSYAGKRLTGLESRGYSKGFSWAYNTPSLKFNIPKIKMPKFNTKKRKVKGGKR